LARAGEKRGEGKGGNPDVSAGHRKAPGCTNTKSLDGVETRGARCGIKVGGETPRRWRRPIALKDKPHTSRRNHMGPGGKFWRC